MRRMILAALILSASAVSANADTFTFTSKGTFTDQVMAQPPGEKPVQAGFVTTTSQTVYASGAKTTLTGSCAQWTMPPGSLFDSHGVCSYTESNGDKATILFGCGPAAKDQSGSDCWGGLLGVSGSRAGKSGTISWRQTTGADGKTGIAKGVGMWPD